MKARFVVIAVVLAALAIGGVSYAAADTTQQGTLVGRNFKLRGPGLLGPIGEISKAAGVDVQQLFKERQEGKSFGDILAAKGADVNALVDNLVASWKTELEKTLDDKSAPPVPREWPARPEWPLPPLGIGPFGGPGAPGSIDAIAKAAGMSIEDLVKERQAGKSFRDILSSEGADIGALTDEIVAGVKPSLDKLVEAGKISAEQAAQRLAQSRESVEKMLGDTSVPQQGKMLPGKAFPGGLRGGRVWGDKTQ